MKDILELVNFYDELTDNELKIIYKRFKDDIANAYHDLSTKVVCNGEISYNTWEEINNLISELSLRTTAIEMILNRRDS